MAAWRRHLDEISVIERETAFEEEEEDVSSNEEVPFDSFDASDAESEISKSSETSRAKKKKAGRRSSWKEEDVVDMVDIVCSSDHYKRKILFTNSKNTRNNDVYNRLLKDLQERVVARGHEFPFNVEQVRNQLKKLIGEC